MVAESATIDRIASQGSLIEWEQTYLAHARGERRDLIPFPEDEIQRLTNSASGEDTAQDAIDILKLVLELAGSVREFDRDAHVLDYGCGWGRMTRLLPYFFRSEGVTGVDVDSRLIGSANQLLPWLDHRCIASMSPLPFESGSFDLIFANSVFSHLSRKSHLFALEELSRLLKTDGILVVSMLDPASLERFYTSDQQREWIQGILGNQSSIEAKLKREGFLWGSTGRWEEYGLSVVAESWIAHNWPKCGLQRLRSARGTHRRAQVFHLAVKL